MKKKEIIYIYFIIVVIIILQLNAVANNPPEKPTIEGPQYARIGRTCRYTIMSNDPECDAVGYNICGWGDDSYCNYSIGLFPSGEEVEISHKWSEEGTYQLKLCAVDCHGTRSDYAILEINIIKIKFTHSFEILFHNHQIHQKLINLFSNF